jgi:hypothetical protein
VQGVMKEPMVRLLHSIMGVRLASFYAYVTTRVY